MTSLPHSATPASPPAAPCWIRAGLERDDAGTVVRVFELDSDLAREVLLPATKADALLDGR